AAQPSGRDRCHGHPCGTRSKGCDRKPSHRFQRHRRPGESRSRREHRPAGGNATGVSFLLSELAPKQLGLLRELLPAASRFGLLVNPKNENAETITRNLKAAAAKISVEISVVQASNSREIEAAFAALVRDKVDALVIGTDPFFYSRRVQLTTLA